MEYIWFGHLVRMQHDLPALLTTDIIQGKDQEEDQEKDGLTVSKKYAPQRI
jgi:hypothetical protein